MLLNIKYGFFKLEIQNLTGPIPKEIYALINLDYLDLSSNDLEGIIDFDIRNLKQLDYLNLSENQLEGNLDSLISFFFWNKLC